MITEVNYLTKEGFEKVKLELHELRTKGRARIAQQIKEAREQGDLSENAEYDAAKDAQGMLELQISKLEEVISNSRLIDESKLDTSKVLVLSTVELKNLKTNKVVKYTLVAEKEADLKVGKISVTSPIGQGLLGKEVGDVAEINVPSGKMEFEILSISRA